MKFKKILCQAFQLVLFSYSCTCSAVSFDFNWPEKLAGEVELISTKSRTTNGVESSSTFRTLWEFSIHKADGGDLEVLHKLIGNDLFKLIGNDLLKPNKKISPDSLAGFLQTIMPTLIVSDKGVFKGSNAYDVINKFITSELDKNDSLSKEGRAYIESILSEKNIQMTAANNWNAIVSSWVSQELESDVKYISEAPSPLPFPGNPTVNFSTEITVSKLANCPNNAGKECVTIITRSSPKEGEMIPVMGAFLNNLARSGGLKGTTNVEELNVVTTMTLITEPNTLVPHHMKTKKVITMKFEANGEKQDALQIQEQEVIYRYK